ncbi:hypothetical protein WQ57_18985 [Mesobacillus campisalis]|uniref:DUF1468 domain-containing protein n=1 Tax=Mesobacillus campisalis TaxID=1408103 RepID=A0A0M2SS34_9BACI|nr:tripartite tricarboxylate transporter TctB family protein [Mesobacillus campisalis]KKK36501.1 hypothetical protein WQ57_18985 [Mesobacillus campisalis]
MDRMISVFIILFGGYWAFKGWTEYGFWIDKTPGSGFLPVIIGIATMLLATLGLLKNNPPVFRIEKKNFVPVIGALLMVASISVFGMIISILLFLVLWLLIVEKFTIKRASILGLSTTLVIYLIFDMVLKVPFPTGIIGF